MLVRGDNATRNGKANGRLHMVSNESVCSLEKIVTVSYFGLFAIVLCYVSDLAIVAPTMGGRNEMVCRLGEAPPTVISY